MQIIYSQPYQLRQVTYEQIKELAQAIERPPYRLSQEQLWHAYTQLEQARVRGAGPQKLLTNIVSLIRFAIGQSEVLEPFPLTVEARFQLWLAEQREAGRQFTSEQIEWLANIKDHIAASLRIEMEDLEYTPFYEMGGPIKAGELFGANLSVFLAELNQVLICSTKGSWRVDK